MQKRTCSLKVCVSKGKPQPINQFRWMPVSRKYTKTCAGCRERNAKHQEIWRDLNPEKDFTSSEKWRKKNKKLLLDYSRQYWQMRASGSR